MVSHLGLPSQQALEGQDYMVDELPQETLPSIDSVSGKGTVCRGDVLFKPIDIKRIARVPYRTVINWIEVGHWHAGILPSIDLADKGRRHSYRIRPQDWELFQSKLQTAPRTHRRPAPAPRPQLAKTRSSSLFRY